MFLEMSLEMKIDAYPWMFEMSFETYKCLSMTLSPWMYHGCERIRLSFLILQSLVENHFLEILGSVE